MEAISTFQTTTATTTSIFFLFLLFLRSSSTLDISNQAQSTARTEMTKLSTKKPIAFRAGSTLESAREVVSDVHGRLDSVYSLASN
jgi:hypothetical protein